MHRSSVIRTTSKYQSDKRAERARSCANKLLRPLLRVLHGAGLNKSQLADVCTRNIRNLPEQAPIARIGLQPHYEPLEHIVARWVSDHAYLERGRSMRLRVRGKRPSFQSLVKSVAPRSSFSAALHLLKQRRVVRLGRDGKVDLVSRFYPARSQDVVDIELFTKMTVDFLRTLECNILENPRIGHGLFQRIAHKFNSDARLAPVFNRYVREQGQLFLEAIDEWLVRHQPMRRKGRSKKRVRDRKSVV